jgi:hypothetical protein
LIRVDATSKAEWDRIVRDELAPLIIPIGADLGAMTAVRLTRLPNCVRGETGQMQQLLYLDPDPDGEPIIDKPLRESPEAVWVRWAQSLMQWQGSDDVDGVSREAASECKRGLSLHGSQFADQPAIKELTKELGVAYAN